MTRIQQLGGRKFVVVLLVLLAATILVSCGVITPLIYRDIIIAVPAAYITGNVAQKVWGKDKEPALTN